jgi:hypothetical protein
MKKVTITWKAFGNDESLVLMLDDEMSDLKICDRLFHETNVYFGRIWDALQPLPENRTHTALSVGDEVTIDDVIYRCEPAGWSVVSAEFIELER